MSRALRGARQALLTIGAVVGVLCILVTVGAALFGLRPLVFRSGSMSPTIDTGALAIATSTDAAALEKGQIVSVPTSTGQRVTHRIVHVEHDGREAVLTLKGDANDTADAQAYRVSHADRVLFSVPDVGYVIGWLTGPAGLFVLGLYAAFLLSVIVRKQPTDPSDEGPRPSGGKRRKERPGRSAAGRTASPALRSAVSLVVVAFSAGTFAQLWALPTLAAWTDAGDVGGTTLTAYTVPQPVLTCLAGTPSSTGNTQNMTYTWPGSIDPGTTYTVSVSGLGTAPTTTLTGTTTKSLLIAYDSSKANNKNAVGSVSVSPALTATSSWTGPQTLTKFRTDPAAKSPGVCGEADPPANVTFVAPDSTSRTVAAEKAQITSACTTSTVILCGTYTDDSAVSMTYTLKRTQGSTVKCWTGSWSNPQTGGVCTTQQTGTTATISGVTSFYETATQNTVFPSTGAGAYVLTVTLTDNFNNVTTDSVSFTLT